MKNFAKRLKTFVVNNPAKIGLCLMLLFGAVFTVVIWPLDIPDEPNHFIRAYQIADGNFFSNTVKTNGFCYAEHDVVTTTQVDSANSGILTPKSVVDLTLQQGQRFNRLDQFRVSLNKKDTENACLRQTNANSPVGYIPQAFVIWVLKLFNAPPILMLYAARLAILATWSLLIYFAIKIIPIRKWAFIGIALIPLAVQQSISIGPDVLSIAPAALLMAIVVRSHFTNRTSHYKKDLLALVVLALVATLSKPVMVLLVIPMLTYKIYDTSKQKKILNISTQRLQIIGLAIIPLIGYGAWSIIAQFNHVSVNDIFTLAAEKSAHGLVSLIPQLIGQASEFIMSGLSVQQFGSLLWFSHTVPELWSYIGAIALFVYIFIGYDTVITKTEGNKKTDLNTFWYYITAIGLIFANIVTLYIIWTPIDGATTVEGVQFRYFLSVFFIASAVYGKRYIQTSTKWFIGFTLIMSFLFFIVSILTLQEYL